MTSRSAGTSNTSRRHSRVVSSSIGNVGCFAAATSRSADRCRCCQSGVRWPGRRRGSSSARAEASRNALANSAVPGQDAHDLFLDLVGIEQQVVERDPVLGLGQADHDAVVAPEHLRAGADALREPRLDREPPRRVHALAERRQDADAPVAELVAEPFDDDRAVVGDGAGRLALIVNVLDQVLRRELVEPDVVAQPLERVRRGARSPARA